MFLSASAVPSTCEEVLVGGKKCGIPGWAECASIVPGIVCGMMVLLSKWPVLVSVTCSQVGSSDDVLSGTVRPGVLMNDC